MNKPTAPLFEPMDAATRARLEDLQGRQGLGLFHPRVQEALPRRWQLYCQQPSGIPDRLPAPVTGLYESPDGIASTARWRRYRDTLASYAAACPDNPNFPVMVQAAEALLAWRNAIPPDDRFWKPDT